MKTHIFWCNKEHLFSMFLSSFIRNEQERPTTAGYTNWSLLSLVLTSNYVFRMVFASTKLRPNYAQS